MTNSPIPHEDLTYKIIGAAMRVHRRLPRGLREQHYQKALSAELIADGLNAPEEYHLEIYDGEVWLGRLYLDHWVNETVVVEEKAVSHEMGDDEIAQVIAYLAATGAKVGLLLNFGRPRLEFKRILPPKSTQGWQTHIAKYLWKPKAVATDYLTDVTDSSHKASSLPSVNKLISNPHSTRPSANALASTSVTSATKSVANFYKALLLSQSAPIASAPLTLVERPLPPLTPHYVRLRLHACGVCHTDLHIVEGDLPMHKTPVTPGHQAVGVVEEVGEGVSRVKVGDRVGVPWLHTNCGVCEFCLRGEENLCDAPTFTGWDVDGGFAEVMLAHESAVVSIPEVFSDVEAAPLLCAGIIGYRSLRCADLAPGEHVGLFGFGASAHIAIQLARHWGCPASVFTRSAEHGRLAESLGAGWWGRAEESPPRPLDRAVIFAPSGALVPLALRHLRKGGTLAINAIHMSPIPEFDYNLLYGERTMRSVTNATHRDAEAFMQLAAQIPVRTEVTTFRLAQANEALLRLKLGDINGAAVLTTSNQ